MSPLSPQRTVRSLELTVRNDLADLPAIRDAWDRFGAEQQVPKRVVIDLQVVLDELASNIIKYAWPEGGFHNFMVRLAVGDGAVEVEVIDDGRPYDPREAPPPVQVAPGCTPPLGGRGIHLVRQLVDRFDYERTGPENRVRLTKRFG